MLSLTQEETMTHIWNWILTVTGSNDTSGVWYGFWSGFCGDLFIVGAIATWYKHHRCATCWRIGHHHVVGTNYNTCHKHATNDTHELLHNKHAKKYPDQHELLQDEI